MINIGKEVEKNKLIKISELAKKIGLINKKGKPLTHTLRYWESKFNKIKPTILEGNQRYYNKKNIDLILMIKYLLKDQGLTIKGVQKILKKNINSLDDYNALSIKTTYFSNKLKIRSKKILDKINKLKSHGKKNSPKS
ncbi:MAG: MerR family transcriptional regulator [Pelagibacteraceae bacterium]